MLALSSATLASLAALPAFASLTDEAIAAMTGGAEIGEGAITLDAPEIAENGNTVPVGVDAPGAVEVALFADGNPVPAVATFTFGPLAASRSGERSEGEGRHCGHRVAIGKKRHLDRAGRIDANRHRVAVFRDLGCIERDCALADLRAAGHRRDGLIGEAGEGGQRREAGQRGRAEREHMSPCQVHI